MGGATARERKGSVGALAVLTIAGVLLGAALSLQAYREAQHPLPPVSSDILYFRGGAAVSRAALGFDALLADVYWIRAIQHSAAPSAPPAARSATSFCIRSSTDDDARPPFQRRVSFRRIFLSEPYPGGPGRTDLAIALLERGIAADPKRWQYAQDAGFVHYWWRQDYKSAAEWFDRASRIEGAPWWLRSMAATTLAEGGDRQSSRRLWQQLLDTTDDIWVRDNARLRLAQLKALDDLDALASLVGRYAQARGAPPRSWNELVAARWLAGSRQTRPDRLMS